MVTLITDRNRIELANSVLCLNEEQFHYVMTAAEIVLTLGSKQAETALKLLKNGVPICEVAERFCVDVKE